MSKESKEATRDDGCPNERVNDIIDEFMVRIKALKSAEVLFKNDLNKKLINFVNSRMAHAIKGKRDVYERDMQRIIAIASIRRVDVQEALESIEAI